MSILTLMPTKTEEVPIFYVELSIWEFLLSLYSTNARILLLKIWDIGGNIFYSTWILYEGFRKIVFGNSLRKASLNERDQFCRVHFYHCVC